MPLAQVQTRYWAGAAAVAAAVAVVVVVLLTGGGTTSPGADSVVPVRLSAAPATLTDSQSCARSAVDVEVTVVRGATVTGASLVVLGRMGSTVRACTGSTPAGAIVVQMPATANTVALPAVARAGNVSLIVLPPASNVSCVWQITVSYAYHGKAGVAATQAFTAPLSLPAMLATGS
ncbi:MAG TPA: hypothetical protein VN969_40540 [Streptosporangiaceae bacterium]|jgi:hypothetical protein|nr:hypothetical protein [Streptosporangiaceae bacterium]